MNPNNKPRVWHLGDSFTNVLHQFAPQLSPYQAFKAKLLHRFQITKTLRTAYDHYMLQLHDHMKLNDTYHQHYKKPKWILLQKVHGWYLPIKCRTRL